VAVFSSARGVDGGSSGWACAVAAMGDSTGGGAAEDMRLLTQLIIPAAAEGENEPMRGEGEDTNSWAPQRQGEGFGLPPLPKGCSHFGWAPGSGPGRGEVAEALAAESATTHPRGLGRP
jgi:hypothetical protein